jgi:hypothetical protein
MTLNPAVSVYSQKFTPVTCRFGFPAFSIRLKHNSHVLPPFFGINRPTFHPPDFPSPIRGATLIPFGSMVTNSSGVPARALALIQPRGETNETSRTDKNV